MNRSTGMPSATSARETGLGIHMELVPPCGDAATLATTFFVVRTSQDHLRDIQPASIGALVIMAGGAGSVHFGDGRKEASHQLMLVSPTTASTTFEVKGQWHAFGAMLSPVGWAGLTGLHAADHRNRVMDARDHLAPALVHACDHILRNFGRLPVDELSTLFSNALLAATQPIPARHLQFIETVSAWLARSLSPDAELLKEETGYSMRQVQRLSERYFGHPPRGVARKYRALRAAVILSRPNLTADEIAAVQDHFYDQSHMIREIRHFAGRTPARMAGPDTPYLSQFMHLRDFRDHGSRIAPIPENIRI